MSAELSYLQLKTAHEARLSEEVLEEQRKRNLLILVHGHLLEQGFLDTARALEKEAGSVVRKFRVCDNIDLLTVLQEYESYYHVKFKKQPKLTKRTSGGSAESVSRTRSLKQNGCGGSISLPAVPDLVHHVEAVPSAHQLLQHQRTSSTTAQASTSDSKRKKKNLAPPTNSTPLVLELEGTPVATHSGGDKGKKGSQMASTDHYAYSHGDYYQDRLLKPLAGFAGYSSEMRELAGVISRDIYLENPNVTWDDIIGLEAPKRLVKEAVVYPIKYPQLFTGILSPWKGLLLYGPPGTGKTLLAKAVATECRTTFFNISASSIVSKWRGDSEKLVRVLFELARFHAPSTIFLDELDALMGQRSGTAGGEHEGSRRMKTELFVQMDGLARSSDLVFLLAASNLPWELDHAMLRRLEKRILVNLPTEEARVAMFSHHLPPVLSREPLHIQTEIDYKRAAQLTEGYSGSDVLLVCKEAAMKPIRRVFDRLEALEKDDGSTSWESIHVDPVVTADVEASIASTKPSAQKLADQYIKWQKQYESV